MEELDAMPLGENDFIFILVTITQLAYRAFCKYCVLVSLRGD